MTNRATRRHPPPATAGVLDDVRVTLPDGRWFRFSQMTARDFLFMDGLRGRKLQGDDLSGIFRLIERRVAGSSETDPLDVPVTDLIEVLRLWYLGMEDAAVPPASATS